jgi:hypothetical protein
MIGIHLQDYFRQKRIQRIEMIRSKTYYSWAKREYKYQTTLIWLKIILHLGILFCLSLACSPFTQLISSGLMPVVGSIMAMVIGWLSVEIHDYIWLNYYKQIKAILNMLYSLLAFLCVVIALIVYFQGSGEGTLIQAVQNWHQQVNQDLQKNSVAQLKVLGEPKGDNWSLVLNSQNQPELLTANQVRNICQNRLGVGWRLPKTNELGLLTPYPILSSHTYIWALNKRDGMNLNLTSLSQNPVQSGQAFVNYDSTDVFPTLCIQKSP